MKLTKRIALILSVLAISLLSAIPAFAAENMGTCEIVKTMPKGFESAIEIEAVKYVETTVGKKNENAKVPYAYVKASKDGSPAFIKYTFTVDKAGMYDFSFALRTKAGDTLREGVFVIDEKYRYDVARKETKDTDTIEYATGFVLAELEAGEHTIILTPSERFNDEEFNTIQLHKILIKYEGEVPVASEAKPEAAVTAPKTFDGITMLVVAAAGAALVMTKKRG